MDCLNKLVKVFQKTNQKVFKKLFCKSVYKTPWKNTFLLGLKVTWESVKLKQKGFESLRTVAFPRE